MICIGVEAVDDRLIESDERVTVTTDPRNSFDSVSQDRTIIAIMDNDGMRAK